jgi:hypothetical protein
MTSISAFAVVFCLYVGLACGITANWPYIGEYRNFTNGLGAGTIIFGGSVSGTCKSPSTTQAYFNGSTTNRYYRGKYNTISGGVVVRYFLTVIAVGDSSCPNVGRNSATLTLGSGNVLLASKNYNSTNTNFARLSGGYFMREVFNFPSKNQDYTDLVQYNVQASADYWAVDNIEILCKHSPSANPLQSLIMSDNLEGSSFAPNIWNTSSTCAVGTWCSIAQAKCTNSPPSSAIRTLTTLYFNSSSGAFVRFNIGMGVTSPTGNCPNMGSSDYSVFLEYSTNSGATWLGLLRVDGPAASYGPVYYEQLLPPQAWAPATQVRWVQYCASPFTCNSGTQEWTLDDVAIVIRLFICLIFNIMS